MHGRHRSPGNGYRSNFTGIGGSRISPEDSAKGHGFYNSEYRSFNRGFGRGQGQMKFYQPLPPPPVPTHRKGGASSSIGGGDIFMEAGRLAAEYLVSQGFLPPSALSGKWQNGSAKGFRFQDGEESRNSRSSSDGKRRYPDYTTGKRRGGSFREDSREYGNSAWSDRARASPDMYGDDNIVSEQDVGNGMQTSGSGEFAPKTEETGYTEIKLDKRQSSSDLGSKASSSNNGKNLSHGIEFSKLSDDSTNTIEGTVEMNDNETEKQCDTGTALSSDSGADLTTLCKFAILPTLCKFSILPTKTRSSLTHRVSKVDSLANNDEETNPDSVSENKIEDLAEDNSLDALNKTQDSRLCSNTEVSEPAPAQLVENMEELGSKFGLERGQWVRSQSFSNIGLTDSKEQELRQSPPSVLQRSATMVMERGEKRALEDINSREGIKKPREWLQPLVTEAEDLIHPIKLGDEGAISHEEKVTVAVPPNVSINNPQFSTVLGGLRAQEKQSFLNSFKICDLNLMEGSDMNENHHNHMMIIDHSISEIKKRESTQVDMDLSMSNSNISGEHSSKMSTSKEIEVIDLDNDSNQEEEKAIEKRTETIFTNLDGFSNNAQNSGPISDVEDHYDGLIITEYLDAFSNSPTSQEDLNPLQNEMGLPHGEGTLVDDDAIYMSLGEIPLSFMPPWENPQPKEYKKPF